MKKLLLYSTLFLVAINLNAQDKTTNGIVTNPADKQRNPITPQKEVISSGNNSPEKTRSSSPAENIVPPKKEENNTSERRKAGTP